MVFEIHWNMQHSQAIPWLSGKSVPLAGNYEILQAMCNKTNSKNRSDFFFWVVALISKPFVIARKTSMVVSGEFDTALDAALFMWGKDFSLYNVFCLGKLLDIHEFEIGRFTEFLESAQHGVQPTADHASDRVTSETENVAGRGV